MSKLPLVYPALDSPDPRVVSRFIVQMFQRIAAAFNNPDFGATAARPASQLTVGQAYYDVTLDSEVWWNGARWANAGTWTVGLPNPNISFQQLSNIQTVYAEISVSGNGGTNYVSLWADPSGPNGLYNISSGPLFINSSSGLVAIGDSTGTTNVALKTVSSTKIEIRLEDDSAFAAVQAKLTTDTNYTNSATTPTGYLLLYDAAGVAYEVPAKAH